MQNRLFTGAALLALALSSASAFAVGGGVPFTFREGPVPAMAHTVSADSLDLTYHSCVAFEGASITESGYFWNSSFQDLDSVVDSQINDFPANGYHIYAKYDFQAEQCSEQETCSGDTRLNYTVTGGSLSLWVDPDSNTTLSLMNCGAVVGGQTADDRLLGSSAMVLSGQKTETNDQANGDFEVVFTNWVFTADGQQLFFDEDNEIPLAASRLVFNANVTRLQGPLTNLHRPEGSGNIFWRP
jgi:hypothetical protein